MSERLFMMSAALFFAGLVAGTAVDDAPPRPPEFRGGFRVLEADFHAHTRFSDGFLSPFDLVIQARRRGLDALAVTEHNIVFPGQMARWFSRGIGGPTILVGEEITTNRFHLIAVGLSERVHAGDPLRVSIAAIHAQGGVAIAAHPVKRYWERFETAIDLLDGTEVMHPIAFNGARAGWAWEDLRAFYENAKAGGHPLTAIGSSDYHLMSPLGVTRTLVFAERDDEQAIVDALKHHKTVVYDLEGHAYGDPDLIALLEREPYTPRVIDYDYRGNGGTDRVARFVGWLGLLGLVVFARPRAGRGLVPA